ncbi:protein-disulfide reductase DsbD [Chitinimonas lacunae]|uniref:Thiol:disulfide interchange protein DsbD n=1 Tax=Chitinimonas lacunae TaxID=1963018 RepID=A0ABV8MWT3_9NEIS
MRKFLSVWLLALWAVLALAADESELLAPEVAFQHTLTQRDARTAVVVFKVAEGYYLYRDRFKFSLEPAGELNAELPPGKLKKDDYFGEVETYRNSVEIVLTASTPFPAGAKLKMTSQGCADAGLCYPPQTVSLALASAEAARPPATAPPASGLDADNPFQGKSLPAVLLVFFVAGLGLAFTACMYPLIPIVSSIIVGQGAQVDKRRGFVLTFVYVQGMAVAYALAGIAAALSGTLLSAALQQPWVLGAFALFFVLMALSMFGLYDLQLPTALQSRLNDASNRLPGGRWLSVLVMGVLSALIVGPCVAPPLAAALGYIGASGDVLLGGAALYVMALGIGLPLIVVGVAGGHVLPKAGPWMTRVRSVFGVLMLALALWIARPVLDDWMVMLAVALLAIGAGIQLSALDPLPTHATGWKRLWKSFGLVLVLVGAAQMVGLLAGSRDPLQPLRVLGGGGAVAAETGLPFQKVRSVAELDAAVVAAAGRPVMLDFYADWCVSCQEMERFTFADPRVRQRLAGAVLLKADVTANNVDDKALLARFKLYGPPGIIFFDRNGKQLAERLVGFEKADPFLQRLDRALAG